MPLMMSPARLFRSPTAPPSTCCRAEISLIDAAVPLSPTITMGGGTIGPSTGPRQPGSMSGSHPPGVPMNPPMRVGLLRELAELVRHLLQLQLRGLRVEICLRPGLTERPVLADGIVHAHQRGGLARVIEAGCFSHLRHHDFVIVRSHVSLHGECYLPDVVALRVPVLDPRPLVGHAERSTDHESATRWNHAEAGLPVVHPVVRRDGVDRNARRPGDSDRKRFADFHAAW